MQSSRIITPSDMDVYGKSRPVRDVTDVLNKINEDNCSQFSQKYAIAARNHLMIVIAMENAARASNLINMSIKDVEKATKDLEFDAMTLTSTTKQVCCMEKRRCYLEKTCSLN